MRIRGLYATALLFIASVGAGCGSGGSHQSAGRHSLTGHVFAGGTSQWAAEDVYQAVGDAKFKTALAAGAEGSAQVPCSVPPPGSSVKAGASVELTNGKGDTIAT